MNFENQLIFFFSALGAFNGLLLSFYFAIISKTKRFSNFFLAFLLLTLSIRIIKSVFFYFNPNLSNLFVQIGISACILIGPFLYLYFAYYINRKTIRWKLHILPFIAGITVLGIAYPYMEYRTIWSKWILKGIYIQWFIYIILSFKVIRPVFKRLSQKTEKLTSTDVWFLSVFIGVTLIWFAYNIGSYTSYIVGALSFSFVIYLIILLFIFKYNNRTSFFEKKEKYKNRKLDSKTLVLIESKLSIVIDEELYCNPNLTLTSIAKDLNIPAHTFSQFLNDNFNKSFSLFINELRIKKAKELLSVPNKYTIEAIGYESGFNSKSTFYTTFKKITSRTPSEYRKRFKK